MVRQIAEEFNLPYYKFLNDTEFTYWEDYKNQPIVELAELSPDRKPQAGILKDAADRYPFLARRILAGLFGNIVGESYVYPFHYVSSSLKLPGNVSTNNTSTPVPLTNKIGVCPQNNQDGAVLPEWYANPIKVDTGSVNTLWTSLAGYTVLDDSWTADWITGATQFVGVEQEAGQTALYQQGLLIPGLGVTAAVFLNQADLAGPTVQIPCLHQSKSIKSIGSSLMLDRIPRRPTLGNGINTLISPS
ncbi:hypothetical protein EMCRGX_G033389 [Ephydatia muelleri]